MKKLIIIVSLILFFNFLNAQTGIGTTTPDASAKLEVNSSNKGFLPPRVTLTSGTDNTTIASPATGLLVYNTGNNAGLVAGYYYWNGSSWATIATAQGSGVSASFMRGSRSSAQTSNLTTNSLVAFTQVDNSNGQEISLNTTTGQITLAAGRTYRLMGQVSSFTSGAGALGLCWYNETTSSWIGSESLSYAPASTAAYGAVGGAAETIITTTTPTVISLRITSGTSVTGLGGNTDFFSSNSYPWFDIQVISGNTAVNGQSVDYISVTRTSDQTVNTGDVVKFNSIYSGNIPYNTTTGAFSLTAGKTYRLNASISLSNANTIVSEANVAWKNAAGDILGNKAEILSSSHTTNAGGNAIVEVIYTPTVNTTVSLYVNYATANAILWNSYTYANIEQIGSSAFVNPWTLAGTNTYNTTGNVGIGTSTPATTLDVTGNVNVKGNLTFTDASNNTSGVATKVSGFVNAGTFIQMENLKVTISTSTRSLVIAAVNTPFTANVSGWYGYTGGGGGGSSHDVSVTTTNTTAQYTWGFGTEGDGAQYNILDKSTNRMYRVLMMIGLSFNNNFISIERLY